MHLKRVGPVSLAKFLGAFYGLIGFLVGAGITLAALAGVAIGGAADNGSEAAWLAPLIGIGAIIALPIFYGLMGAIGGLVSGWIFNLVARVTGGLEIVLE